MRTIQQRVQCHPLADECAVVFAIMLWCVCVAGGSWYTEYVRVAVGAQRRTYTVAVQGMNTESLPPEEKITYFGVTHHFRKKRRTSRV